MTYQCREASISVSLAVFDLRTDLFQGLALPSHGCGRQMPFRVPRNPGLVVVCLVMARRTLQSRGSVSFGTAHDPRTMWAHEISLGWAFSCRMTVHTARMLQNLRRFIEQRD